MEDMNKDLQKALQLMEDIREMESIDTDAAYARFQRAVETRHTFRFKAWALRVAAILVLPLLVSTLYLGYKYIHFQQEMELFSEVVVSDGVIQSFELPDGSKVYLNSGSSLRYPVRFKEDSREVTLNGEGYFEVQADRQHPFYVHTPQGLSVMVHGTKFNLMAYEDASSIETVLEEGKVTEILPNRKSVPMEPGECVIYDKLTGKVSKGTVDMDEKLAWREGKLIFRDASIEEIFTRLARHFNVEVNLVNKQKKEYRFHATFRDETLDQILHYLSESANMKWTFEKSKQLEDGSFSKKKIDVTLY
ncbi:MAG: DUF4974 domain-containing protein [Bacteroidales bacterium]|nr:DUF4974 domain-containing protein [Bacteroidales bacterium]